MGIDVDRAHRVAWSLGVAITAIAGGLVATFQTFQPYIGFDFVIVMYAGVVLGHGGCEKARERSRPGARAS